MVNTTQRAGRVRYLVLESRQAQNLLGAIYTLTGTPQWAYLFADSDWQAYLDESPIVLEAVQDSKEYGWALQGLKEGELSGLILESSKGMNCVLDWLRARLTVSFGNQRKGLLRYYDPHIWRRLAPQTSRSEEVVDRIIHWDDTLGIQKWVITDHPEPVAMAPVPTLSETQLQALSAQRA